ncbi:MAG: FMN-binding negative transcriptional regulator [Pseudomonadota bacterium]
MYIPSSFRESRIERLHDLIVKHPLGLLITHGDTGLEASPIPFLLYADEGKHGILRAHLAKANPHWKSLAGHAECLVVFQGPDGYVTPSWYPSKAETHKVVPTWNYATVQVWGHAAVIEDPAWLRRQLDDLTADQEMLRPQPWSVSDAPTDYIATQMKAIIGIEIPINRIDGKWKMSQNKDNADREGVIAGMRSDTDPHRNIRAAEVVEKI